MNVLFFLVLVLLLLLSVVFFAMTGSWWLFGLAFFFSPLIIGTIFLGWQASIKIIHSDSQLEDKCFVGYCWTYFFFGFFVPIFRGEIMVGVLHFILTAVTFGLFHLIIPFLYNKQHARRLLNSSWILNDTDMNNSMARKKLGIAQLKVTNNDLT